jgi:hypothetical protein
LHHLDDAAAIFRRLPSDWIDRRTLEETLGVSKTVAWRILRRCGAVDGPGNTLVCRRESLIAGLERLRDDESARREIRRRERVESRLGRLLAAARSQHVALAPAAEGADLVSSRFARLPEGIELEPRELRIRFADSGDFLRKVGAIVFALQNDLEEIRDFIDLGVSGAKK